MCRPHNLYSTHLRKVFIVKKAVLLFLSFSLTCVFLVSGCDSDSDENNNEPVADTQSSDTSEQSDIQSTDVTSEADGTVEADTAEQDVEVATPRMPDLPPGELATITPGGDTICSRGTPFRYFVDPGTVNKIIIDFAGGGACWNELTCSVAGAIFNEEAPDEAFIKAAMEGNLLSGIYDRENPDNPFKDWYLIHIPYCTGDVHWGNATHDYGNDIVIEHKGFVNVSAVLSWVYENFEAPEQIFVTGCSAGSYGAIVHSAFIANHYPDTQIAVRGDSGTGVITDSFFSESFPNWNAQSSLPEWIPALAEADIFDLDITDIYVEISNNFPQHRFSQYTTAFDSNQEFYFTAMGGDELDWNLTTVGYLEDIRSKSDNFRYYLMHGEVHCVTPYDIFYTNKVGDSSFLDWVNAFVDGEDLPDDVACEGDDCLNDPVCDLCEETEGAAGMYCGFCE